MINVNKNYEKPDKERKLLRLGIYLLKIFISLGSLALSDKMNTAIKKPYKIFIFEGFFFDKTLNKVL